MKNSFEEIVIPHFIYEDGSQSAFTGYVRDRESGGRSEEFLRVFDDRGHYYGINLDKRRDSNQKRPTLFIEKKAYKYKIDTFSTFDCKVNPYNGHLLVPHKCEDSSCKVMTILFGGAR